MEGDDAVWAILVASLIVGAYHTAGQAGSLHPQPYPLAEHRESVRDVAPEALLAEAESAIKANDQARACALVHRHGEPQIPHFESQKLPPHVRSPPSEAER